MSAQVPVLGSEEPAACRWWRAAKVVEIQRVICHHLRDCHFELMRACCVQVVVCSNHVSAQEEVNHTLTHELIHAFDHCRAADLDWRNCEHHACSEVRFSWQVESVGGPWC